MVNRLTDFINVCAATEFATAAGTVMHQKLCRVFIGAGGVSGDADLVCEISSRPELHEFFSDVSMTEVPIAGTVGGRFVSRRIDRLVVNHDKKTVFFLDYKTGVDNQRFYTNYLKQMSEYTKLLQKIYPSYSVRGFILWIHNWTLQEI